MSPVGLAWRSLSRQPLRAVLGIVGVTAVGALLFDMLLLSRGLVISFGDILRSLRFDVRVTATSDLPTMGPPIENAGVIVRQLRGLPEVAEVVPFRFAKAEALEPGGASQPFDLTGTGGRASWTLLEGSDELEAEDAGRDRVPSMLINRNLARKLGVSPGATLKVRGLCSPDSAAPGVTFRVAGIVELAFESLAEMAGVTTLQGLEKACGDENRDRADLLLIASRRGSGADAAVAAIGRLRPELHAFSNEQFLSRFERTDFSYFRQISFVLSTTTLFFAFLLVATLLTVSVNQRFAEIAALRAIGFSRRRVVADLLCESALLVGAGGLLSLPVGGLLAWWLDAILRSIPDLPLKLHFFVFDGRALLLHLSLLAATGLLAAVYPTFLAARLPIADTLRREVVS